LHEGVAYRKSSNGAIGTCNLFNIMTNRQAIRDLWGAMRPSYGARYALWLGLLVYCPHAVNDNSTTALTAEQPTQGYGCRSFE
jgi:hypothetical protein